MAQAQTQTQSKSSKQIAFLLTGCGFRDGSEISEAISCLISLSALGASVKAFSLDREVNAVNHVTGESELRRNMLVESARLVRGQIARLETLKPQDFDGIVLPGGFGAALHFCDWAKKGAQCEVDPKIRSVLEAFYQAQKPILAVCIAPALIAKVLGSKGVTVTIGNEPEVIAEIKKTGAHHVECEVDDYVTDREHKIITTPAYMYDSAAPFAVFTGVQRAVKEFIEMA